MLVRYKTSSKKVLADVGYRPNQIILMDLVIGKKERNCHAVLLQQVIISASIYQCKVVKVL